MRASHIWLLTLWALAGVAVCGCETASSPHAVSADDAEADHDHDEHDHDHHDPEHKPATYPESVDQLKRLRSLVARELRAGHAAHAQPALNQLRDTLRWLPELAADSDLRKPEWDVVNAAAGELGVLYASAGGDVANLRVSNADVAERIDALVAELERIARDDAFRPARRETGESPSPDLNHP